MTPTSNTTRPTSKSHDDSSDRFEESNGVHMNGGANTHGDSGFFTAEGEETTTSEEQDNHSSSTAISYLKLGVTIVGILTGFILCFVVPTAMNDNRQINQTLAIAIWMATLWLTEIIPLVVTALLPLVLFPLFGILDSSDVALQYMNNTIWLLIAGFLLALTLERWACHRRISLKLLTWCGARPPLLLLGMMAATFFLSMFVSNTATTLMMVPNAISVCTILQESSSSQSAKQSTTKQPEDPFAHALLLGIAYAANVGGMSSLIGTAPNLVFHRQLELLFPGAPELTFAHWTAFGLPTGLVLFAIIWIYLCVRYLSWRHDDNETEPIDPTLFQQTYVALGAWTREQITVCTLFVTLCLLWIFRSDIDLGEHVHIPGWANLFPDPSYISDATTGMMIVLVLFVCPARSCHLDISSSNNEGNDTIKDADDDGEDEEVGSTTNTSSHGHGEEEDERLLTNEHDNKNELNDTTLLNWETANKMPYDVVFLLGGGFALAKAFVDSGLSEYLGEQLATLRLEVVGLVFLMITMIIWLTELTSNTSTSNIMIPIAASMAVATQTSPYTFMIPATMACSCAFVLPIATPPNMVVFSTGRLPMAEMNKAGVFLNVIGSALLLGATYTIIPAVMGVAAEEFPEWAQQ
ncbi:Sodium-dependent dicarboxylate transporter SdcS [Seminavis robusta]|uniref:Sodium-dependent dicarboxylate transporter SdcS n=1 Tax=Seminavis robusta TaxID=568900 RepID=A0A9N8DX57_9STRA|nr:Sodium-dependent dicarboxylate transporter SdcS [Seminavis robusta]|eukprot:Sro313_g114750.1 Sodium-dependent dicarboxylate transporter SdcS (637) ;mRNA; r:18670-20580